MLPLRLRRVTGHEGRVNDALFHPAATVTAPVKALVFFGGDVQVFTRAKDYPELMQVHRDNRNFIKWNLENTARLLSRYFPTKHIIIIKASRIEFKSFSCYDNFVPSNNAGVPDHTPTHNALHHLERLLQNINNRLKTMPVSDLLEAITSPSIPEEIDIEDLRKSEPSAAGASGASTGASGASTGADANTAEPNPLWWREKLALDECQLTVMGFSKGCVVLNQFIYEFHYTKTLTPGDVQMTRFIERIEEMYWLDGGHAGGKNTWITSRSLLETLTRLNVKIWVHVSPYQVRDESRPWIRREERAFTRLLRELGAKIHRYFHEGVSVPQSLHTHFDVLANFMTIQQKAPDGAIDSSDEE